jgi:hypothetical protein
MNAPLTIIRIEIWPIDHLVPYARNPRKNEQLLLSVLPSEWHPPVWQLDFEMI